MMTQDMLLDSNDSANSPPFALVFGMMRTMRMTLRHSYHLPGNQEIPIGKGRLKNSALHSD